MPEVPGHGPHAAPAVLVRGVQHKLVRAVIDWLVRTGRLTIMGENGTVDQNSRDYLAEREKLVDGFLREDGEAIWPAPAR